MKQRLSQSWSISPIMMDTRVLLPVDDHIAVEVEAEEGEEGGAEPASSLVISLVGSAPSSVGPKHHGLYVPVI
jgi:hypothetical protein